ncbi:MAG: sigma 54-interacting transcriptional regulator [Polyangiaceae bacterium]|jgi:transcriptional regulator with PAS, ATPase and Fis domain
MTRSIHEDATTQIFNQTEEVVSIRGGRIEVPDEGIQLQIGEKPLVIGRSRRCDLVLDDKTVTALHMEVQATPKGVRVLDLKSRNGSFLHDARFTEVYLNGTWELRCGAKRLRFVADPPHDVIVRQQHRFGDLIGTTPEMLKLFGLLHKFAPSTVSILIRGETGTGKERVARAIHDASPRRNKPFLPINCATGPDSLLEGELFGHVRGAFTGADRERKGLFVEAHGGTLFFDEVAQMSPGMQAKLLRALENREVRPLGSDHTRKVDVRTLFATHGDLRHEVNLGTFREDLFHRIAKLTVEIPPLRDRLDDLMFLVQSILEDFGRPDAKLDDAGMAKLLRWRWPGNVRELRNVVEVALVTTTGNVLAIEEAWAAGHDEPEVDSELGHYDAAKQEFDRRFYTRLYAACHGNVTHIAQRAGKQRYTVREALRAIGLVAPSSDADGDAEADDRAVPEPKRWNSGGRSSGKRDP